MVMLQYQCTCVTWLSLVVQVEDIHASILQLISLHNYVHLFIQSCHVYMTWQCAEMDWSVCLVLYAVV